MFRLRKLSYHYQQRMEGSKKTVSKNHAEQNHVVLQRFACTHLSSSSILLIQTNKLPFQPTISGKATKNDSIHMNAIINRVCLKN